MGSKPYSSRELTNRLDREIFIATEKLRNVSSRLSNSSSELDLGNIVLLDMVVHGQSEAYLDVLGIADA